MLPIMKANRDETKFGPNKDLMIQIKWLDIQEIFKSIIFRILSLE